MFLAHKKNDSKGLTLVEILIATSIILTFFVSLITVYNLYLKVAANNLNTVKAVFLAEEGVEAIKFLRDSSWANNIAPLTAGTNYYLTFSGGMWRTTTTNTFIDSTFERKINFVAVNRDVGTEDIVLTGGVDDPNTKFVTVSISWSNRGATTTKTISTYITNHFNN